MDQKVVNEAIWRWEEVTRLNRDLTTAIKEWADWLTRLNPEEQAAYRAAVEDLSREQE